MPTKTVRTPPGTLSYTDAGTGPPIVFLHGNPTSARLYRHLIRALVPDHRCIAPDYLGFGRSEAPADCSYRPSLHATLIERLLLHLNVDNITLVLHDWGGPIGLSFAIRNPSTVRRLVLMNTWAWPLTHRPLIRIFSALAGTPVGRFLIERRNAFPRVVMPSTAGSLPINPPSWIQPYVDALDTRPRRQACWTLARSLLRETDWLRALWTHRHRLPNCPALLCWGMTDPAFGTTATLSRWEAVLPRSKIRRYRDVGHYIPEELGSSLISPVAAFLRTTRP